MLRACDPFSTVSDAFWLHFRCFRTTSGSISGGFRWRSGAISSLDPLSRPFPWQRAPPRRAVFLRRPTDPPTAPGASGSPGTWPRTCPDAEPPQHNAQGPEGGRRWPPPRGNSIRSSAHHLDQAPTIPPPSASAEEQGVLDAPTRVFQLLLPSPFRFLSPCPVLPGPCRSCPPPKVLPGPCT